MNIAPDRRTRERCNRVRPRRVRPSSAFLPASRRIRCRLAASCAALNAHGISPETLGFEITEALCTQRRAHVERFLTQCEKVGSWVVIDDFSFDSQVLPLLRSKAVRLVKIDAKLTSSALKDKLSQAMVVATVQAAKVLGIHCAAKRVESQASLQWLTAIGCDLAQGPALSQVLPIESLNMPQPPPPAAEAGKAS